MQGRHGKSCYEEHVCKFCGHDSSDKAKTHLTGEQDSLWKYINHMKIRTLNEHKTDAGSKVFKSHDHSKDLTTFVESGVDEELIFFIPFTCAVKIQSIFIRGGEKGTCPKKFSVWKNREDIDFDNVEDIKPQQSFDVVYTDDGLEYQLKRSRFQGCNSITIYVPECIDADETRIYYIGLKGKGSKNKRGIVKNAIYESAPMVHDHIDETKLGPKYRALDQPVDELEQNAPDEMFPK